MFQRSSSLLRVAARCIGPLAPLAASLLVVVGMPHAAFAAPDTSLVEGVLHAGGDQPAADGTYKLTFSLYQGAAAQSAVWSEGPLDVKVTGGRFVAALGSKTPLAGKDLAALKDPWLGVQVGSDPELPRQELFATPMARVAGLAAGLSCDGCVQGDQLANGGIAASKIGFNYAASTTKGGPALDLACTGCVSVAEMKFDGDVDLGGNSIKAKNGTFSGDVVAKTMTANAFVGDGSGLTGVKLGATACKTGQVVRGIAADGSLLCTAGGGDVGAATGGLLSTEFTDAQGAPKANLPIPDNTGADASSTITFPDLGTAKGIKIAVKISNTDLSTVQIKLLPPDDKKVGYVLCDPCGQKDEKALAAEWSHSKAPKSGDLSTWLGNNPMGEWTLVVNDSSFCVPQAPGNATLCDLNAKTDGLIIDWSVEAQTISTKKIAATSALQLSPLSSAPLPCTENHMGALYFDKASKSLRYCDGSAWRTLADTCGNGIVEPNEQCDDGNNADGDGCSKTCQTTCGDKLVVGAEECDDGNQVGTDACDNSCKLTAYGTDKAMPGTSCLDIFTQFKAAGVTQKDGSYWIKAPKGQVIAVDCDMSTEGGGYTYFTVASGKTTSRSTDDNTCKDYGLDIVYPRSKAQWTWMLAKYDTSYFSTIPGVTKPGNGGNYTGCVMRDPKSYGSGCGDWKVPDGGRWWLRDATYSEPNGDYTANCWLSMYQHTPGDIRFNDGNCSYSTSKYVCSTNDKK